MNCKQCDKELPKKLKAFCNNECKSKHQSDQPKLVFDDTKQYKSKIDGKCFSLGAKQSGQLKKYSVNSLNKEFNLEDWEIVDKLPNQDERWNCPHCNWSGKTKDGKDNGGWVGKHLLDEHGITKDAHIVDFPNDKLWSHSLTQIERLNILNEHEHNRIQCLECNEWFIALTNTHLRDKHNMTKDQYRIKHDIDIMSSESFRDKMRILYYKNVNLISSSTWRSKYEEQICNLLTDWKIPHNPNSKELGFDVDIFIPSFNLAIEFNGLYWHSEMGGGKLEHYHFNKTLLCEKNGIKLIHIFEDEWLFKKDIVISRIKNELKLITNTIHARKCEVKELPFREIRKFLDDNHLQGQSDPTTLNFGLYYNSELVSLMTFKRGGKENEIELKRFCSKINTNVVGAANKLLKYFENKYKPIKLFSFADRRWTDLLSKSVYDVLGFTLTSCGEPNYWYLVYPNKRSNRKQFNKDKILNIFKKSDRNLSEWKNMVMLGYDRIWDCGSLKYEKVYDKSDIKFNFSQPIVHKSIKQRKNKRNKKENSRKSIDITCQICENEYSINGFSSHLKLSHNTSVDEYINLYGEYRPKEIEKSTKQINLSEKFVCLECNKDDFYSHKSYIQHINKHHTGGWESYVIKYIFNDIRPTCQCGCYGFVKITTKAPFRLNFVTGHNSRKIC
jgi:hypothetical protein